MYKTERAWDISLTLLGLAICHDQLGNIMLNQHFSEYGLALQQEVGDPEITNRLVKTLGYSHMLAGNYKKALWLVQQQNKNNFQVNDRYSQAEIFGELGLAKYHAGQFQQSRELCNKAVDFYTQPEDYPARNFFKYISACNDLLLGNYSAIIKEEIWLGENSENNYRADFNFLKGWIYLLEREKIDFNDVGFFPDFDRAEQAMRSYQEYLSSLPRFDVLGLPLVMLAYIAYRRNQMNTALKYIIEALENGIQHGYFFVNCTSLAILALILAEDQQFEQAVELYAIAETHPFFKNGRIFEDLFGRRILRLVSSLPDKAVDAARARCEDRELTSVVQEYLNLLRTSGWEQFLN
jgi:tetratricopeptide (TPR) repeat protein